jgi:hypothetical protein
MTALSEDAREKLQEKLAELGKAISAVEEARKPFDDAIAALVMVRDAVIEEAIGDKDIVGSCEFCERLLLDGDKGHRGTDGVIVCEACAPTYGCLKKQREEMVAESDDPEDDNALCLASIEAHIAAGGSLDDKVVHEL